MKTKKSSLRAKVQQLIQGQQRQATRVTKQTDRSIERYFFGRLHKLAVVRRFVIAWTLLVLLLIGAVLAQNSALTGYYQTTQPVAGGIFREGILGTFTNANPMYATSDVDLAVSRLLFSGLFKYDQGNKLTGDLAESWSVDKTDKVYTIKLRKGLVWHDGKPLTAHDVAFTYNTIKNPDAESPLRPNWVGIEVAVKDNRTLTFTLPNPLSSFVYNLTNGIVPEHLLKGIPATGMRSADFNTHTPIGAGPFQWQDIKISGHSTVDVQSSIGLVPFEHYWSGEPKLRALTIHAFAKSEDMIASYKDNQLNAMAGLSQMPDGVDDEQTSVNSRSFIMTAANMVFFRTTSDVFKDVAVRRALVAAADPAKILEKLPYQAARVHEPILSSQFAYNKKYIQKTADQKLANNLLTKAGWKLGPDGKRIKKSAQLSFRLVVANTAELRTVAEQLQKQWATVGVQVDVSFQDEETFHNSLIEHDYDAVLYGITIGSDPDVFVYWDSSQNDARAANRLNLSEYGSDTADLALEAGRTRSGLALRRAKYDAFLKAWQADAPALGLYQPRFLYINRTSIYGLDKTILNVGSERYDNVSNWMIRTARVTNKN